MSGKLLGLLRWFTGGREADTVHDGVADDVHVVGRAAVHPSDNAWNLRTGMLPLYVVDTELVRGFIAAHMLTLPEGRPVRK